MTEREKFELWVDEAPNQRYGTVYWECWQACTDQKEMSDALRHETGAQAIEDMLKSMTYLDFDTAMRYANRLRGGLK